MSNKLRIEISEFKMFTFSPETSFEIFMYRQQLENIGISNVLLNISSSKLCIVYVEAFQF